MRLTPRRRRTPGWCWRRAPSPRMPAASRSTSRAKRTRARSIAPFRLSELAQQPLKVTNTGRGDVQAVVSVSGAPTTPEPAAEKGFKIERLYYTLDGEAADPAKAKQNQRFVGGAEDHRARAAVRPRHRCRLSAGGLRDRQSAAGVVRRHRHAVLDRGRQGAGAIPSSATTASARRSNAIRSDPVVFSVAYVVRAVSPGHYVLPQAYVEDMYRPDRFGRTETGTIEVTAK